MNRKVNYNGQDVEIPSELAQKLDTYLDDSKFYDSSSKGRILLKDMADEHLKNAYLKEINKIFAEKMEKMKSSSLNELSAPLVIVSKTYSKLRAEIERRTLREGAIKTYADFFGLIDRNRHPRRPKRPSF